MTTFQTILMLLLFAGLIVCHEAISKERHLTDKNVLRTLRKLGATILETYSDGLVIFQMEDVSF